MLQITTVTKAYVEKHYEIEVPEHTYSRLFLIPTRDEFGVVSDLVGFIRQFCEPYLKVIYEGRANTIIGKTISTRLPIDTYCALHEIRPHKGQPCMECAQPYIDAAYLNGVNNEREKHNPKPREDK